MTDADTWLEVPLDRGGLLVFDGRVVELFSGLAYAWRVPAHLARIEISAPSRKGRRTVSVRPTYSGPMTSGEVATEHDSDLHSLAAALPDGTVTWA